MKTLNELKAYHQRQVGKKEQIELDVSHLNDKLKVNRKHVKNLERAHEIVRIVGEETQTQLKYHISDITSLALSSVFENPYNLVLNFEKRRGKVECDLLFERNGEMIKPKRAAGYGSMDIASLALRIACWNIQTPTRRAVIILDEPFRHLSKKYHETASQMIKELSDKLGIQFIITTHIEALAAYADKSFRTKIRNGVTTVTEHT